MRTTNVLLVEDHRYFREALALMLNQRKSMEVVAQAGSLFEGQSTAVEEIDVAIVDLSLPDGEGTTLIGWLCEQAPRMSVLALMGEFDLDQQHRALQAGAKKVLAKTASVNEIIDALGDLGRPALRAV